MTGRGPVDLHGKVALVTGGGTGIGLATSLALARAGAAVALNYSKNEITPTGKLPTTEDTAAAIFYLATAPALIGQTITVDGGLVALGPRS